MKYFLLILTALTLTACGESSTNGSSDGLFKAVIKMPSGDKRYNIAVQCVSFDDDFDTNFAFISDRLGYKDIDGDGIIIRGDRVNIGKDKSPIVMNGITIRVSDNGAVYESNLGIKATMGKQETWKRTESGVTGEIDLYLEDDKSLTFYPAMYEVICQ